MRQYTELMSDYVFKEPLLMCCCRNKGRAVTSNVISLFLAATVKC